MRFYNGLVIFLLTNNDRLLFQFHKSAIKWYEVSTYNSVSHTSINFPQLTIKSRVVSPNKPSTSFLTLSKLHEHLAAFESEVCFNGHCMIHHLLTKEHSQQLSFSFCFYFKIVFFFFVLLIVPTI